MPPKKYSNTASSADGTQLSLDLSESDAALGATVRGILENLREDEVAAVGPALKTGGHRQGPGRGKAGLFGPVDAAKVKRQLEEQMNPTVMIQTGDKAAHSRKKPRVKGKASGRELRLKIAKIVELRTAVPAGHTTVKGDVLDLALAQADKRGSQTAIKTLASDEMVTSSEMTTLIGISRQAVDKRRLAGQLLALKGGPRTLKYPRWQILPTGQVVPGLEEILGRFDGDTWAAYRMLKEIAPDGTDRPLYELLREGELDTVLAHIDGVLAGAGT